MSYHRSMTTGEWVLWGLGAATAVVNIATMRRLWASPMFERPQKIAQTVLMWILPGSFLVVRHLLGESRPRRGSIGTADSTVDFVWFDAANDGSSSANHHGWDGGGHGGGGGDFGGGHG